MPKNLALQVSTIFVDPEVGLDVLDMTYNIKPFGLAGVYATKKGPIQNDLFKCLESFLVASKTLVVLGVLGGCNAILEARLDSVG